MHRAGATLRDAAAKFRAGQADLVAHDPKQRRLRLDIELMRVAVDLEGDHGVAPRTNLWQAIKLPHLGGAAQGRQIRLARPPASRHLPPEPGEKAAMKVYVWDLLAYGGQFDEYKADRYLPYPLPRRHFDPEIAARTYAEHLEAWQEMDRLGFDGVGFNEHHTTPHGLMNSPNMMAAVGAQHTERLKFLMLGNLLPLHNPLRIAEEIAMADCLSRGRVMSGFARGIPREYEAYQIPMAESRARFEEAFDDHHQGLDRGELLARGQVLDLQGRGDLAAAIPAAASAGLGPVHRQQGDHRVGRRGTT